MGAGASSKQALDMREERDSEEAAKKLFGSLAVTGETLSVEDVYNAAQAHGKLVKAYWSRETIEAKLAMYDGDKDGRITCQEYLAALADMKERPEGETVAEHAAKLKKSKGKKVSIKKGEAATSDGTKVTVAVGSSSVGETKAPFRSPALKRSWTWKKIETPPEPSALDAALADLEKDVKPPPNLEEAEAAFWTKQHELDLWVVPLRRDRNRMPWLGPEETGMSAAVKHAHSCGKTALLLEEDSQKKPVEQHYYNAKAEVMKASHFLQLEVSKEKSHVQVMDMARKQLVKAMRDGKTLFIQLDGKVTDFTGGQESNAYADEDNLPISIFDRRQVDALLEKFVGDAAALRAARERGDGFQGLWESDHAFAKVLRDADCDLKGDFMVKPGFQVIVCTQLKRSEYATALRSSLPWMRLQPILVDTSD